MGTGIERLMFGRLEASPLAKKTIRGNKTEVTQLRLAPLADIIESVREQSGSSQSTLVGTHPQVKVAFCL
jgi:hypothetical protein